MMSMDAPKTLNTLSNAGATGLAGTNFMGAVTQQFMKLSPTTQPAEVATFLHYTTEALYSKHNQKVLKKAGIKLEDYTDENGKFKGPEGMLKLYDDLREKGYNNPIKLGQLGFTEIHTVNGMRQIMANTENIRGAMREGEKAARKDLVGAAFLEAKQADFGKIKAAEIEIEKARFGELATKATGVAADAVKWATENPGAAAGAAGAVMIGGRWVYKSAERAVSGIGGKALEAAGDAVGSRVFVTNWPPSLGGSPIPGKGKFPSPDGGAAPAGAVVGGSVLGLGAGLAGTGLAFSYLSAKQVESGPAYNTGNPMLGAMGGDYSLAQAIMEASTASERKKEVEAIQELTREIKASRNQPVVVQIDGKAVATAVNKDNTREGRRQ
jgi:hypothetical protein